MNVPATLVDHYMLLIKNNAYMAANGINCAERMTVLILRATEHLYSSKIADECGCRLMLKAAIEDELCHVHSAHPDYAGALKQALGTLSV